MDDSSLQGAIMRPGGNAVGVLAYCGDEFAAGDDEVIPTLCVFQSPPGPIGFDTTREIEELFIDFLSRATYFNGQRMAPAPSEQRALMLIRRAYFPDTAIAFFYFPVGADQDEKSVTDAVVDLLPNLGIDDDKSLNRVLLHSKKVSEAGFQLIWPIAFGEALRIYPGKNNNDALQVLLRLASEREMKIKHVENVSALPCW